MNPQIFLIAPMNAETETFPANLAQALESADVSVLFLPKGAREDTQYEAFAKAVLPVAQNANCAVLLDNTAALAKKIGADGVHMSTGIKAFQDALDMLKPDMIVGAGAIHSRHDAMAKGEIGADYVFFGALSGATDPDVKDEAAWWAETFEIPAVFCDPAVPLAEIDALGCEFIGVSDAIWSAPEGPAKILASIAERFEPKK